MADEALNIVIGAQVGGLISGIEVAQQQLASLQTIATSFAGNLGGLNQSLGTLTGQLNQHAQAHQQSASAVQAHAAAAQTLQSPISALGGFFSNLISTLFQGASAHQTHAAAVHEHGSAMHGLLSPIHEVTHAFTHLIGLLGVGWGAHEAVHQLTELAEQAEHIENVAASIGMSPKDFAALSGAIQIATGDADLAARTFQTLERNARNALTDPQGTQGKAAEGLGLTTAQLEAGLKDPNAFIETLISSYQKNVITAINPGEGISNFKDFVGRDIDSLTPIFARGLDHFRELKQEALELTGWTNKSIEDLAKTAEQINRIPLAFVGLKKQIYDEFRDPIVDTINQIKESLKEGGGLITFLNDVASVFKFIKENAPDLGGGTKREFSGVGDLITKGKDFDSWLKTQTWGSLLGFGGGGAATDKTEVIVPVGGHASARENFAHFNYGNIKAAGGGWNEYAGPEEGTQAIADWLVRSQEKHGTDTLAKIIERYSPESDNRGKHLPEAAARATGLDLNQIIDVHDEAIRQKIVSAILKQEGAPAQAFATRAASSALHGAETADDHGGHAEAEKTNVAERAVNYGKLKQELDDNIKAIEARRDALLKYYDVEIKGARDNAAVVVDLEGKKEDVIKRAIAEDLAARQAAMAKAGSGAGGALFRTQTMAGVDDKSAQRLEELQIQALGREQQAQDKVTAAAMSADETQRKIADQTEQTLLRSVQHRLQMQQLTVDQAATAELQIVNDHKAAVDRILDDERRLAGESVKLNQDVDNRKREADQKYADEHTKILEKSEIDAFKRAESINKEIARTASSTIVDLAWGKTTPGQAVAGIAQDLEKRALDAVLTNERA